ncbi:hypothetical protein [Vreelandella sp. V005]|uniref:hypothetical protein n=1 Tax=Vreelandella sp. V005 TaxID=3459608 RepID=UPI004044782B
MALPSTNIPATVERDEKRKSWVNTSFPSSSERTALFRKLALLAHVVVDRHRFLSTSQKAFKYHKAIGDFSADTDSTTFMTSRIAFLFLNSGFKSSG